MLYGVYCSNGSGPDYSTALAYADFVNGVYKVANVDVAASAIIDLPSQIVGGTGLVIVDTDPSGVTLIGAFLAAFISENMTICIEWTQDDSYAFEEPIVIEDSSNLGVVYCSIESARAGIVNLDDERASTFREVAIDLGTPGSFPITRNAAFTVLSGGISMSVDGSSVGSDTTALSALSPDVVTLGCFSGNTPNLVGTIRRLAVFSPLGDSLLPIYSAL